MLDDLDSWLNGSAAEGAADAQAVGSDDRRRGERYRLRGGEVFLFLEGDQRCRMRLRDVCSLGLSGLSDEPLTVGQRVIVQLEEMLMPAADVVWTRCAMVGLTFVNPLPLTRFNRLRERHEAGAAWSPAMRAGSDLYRWWTDAEAHDVGRRPELNSGGHDNPLPR